MAGSWWVSGSWGSVCVYACVCVCVCVCVRWAYSLGIHKDLYRAQELTVVDPSFQMNLVMLVLIF